MRHVGWCPFAECAIVALTLSIWCHGLPSDDKAKNRGHPDPNKGAPSLLMFDNIEEVTNAFEKLSLSPQNDVITPTTAPRTTASNPIAAPPTTGLPAVEAVPDRILYDLRRGLSTVILKCPHGHLISVISANGKCGGIDIDLKPKVWELCGRKSSCQFDNAIVGRCNDKIEIESVTYVCSKVQAMDCFLFNGKTEEDDRFCLHMCMHFLKSCQSTTMPVTRQERLKCLYNLYVSHNLNKKCDYIMDNVGPDNVFFQKNEYFNPKYDMGKVTVTKERWVRVKFKTRIENPVVVTSALHEDDKFVILFVDDVTTTGFRISVSAVDCNNKCITSWVDRDVTVQWLAIASGDHSPEMDKSIKVGSLDIQADETGMLPLDTGKSWVVLTQVQKIRQLTNPTNTAWTQILALPVILRGIWDFTAYFVLPAADKISETIVTLGYVAFEDKEDMNLYGVGLKMFMSMADDYKRTSIKMKLPYTWPYPSNIFAETMTFTEFFSGDLISHVSSVHMSKKEKKDAEVKMGHYYFTSDLLINYLHSQSVKSAPAVNVVILEDISSALKRQVCNFAKKKGKRNVSNACYDECIGRNGIAKCVDEPDLIACYTERSRSCYLNPQDMKPFVDQYVKYVKAHPEERGSAADSAENTPSIGSNQPIPLPYTPSAPVPKPSNPAGATSPIDPNIPTTPVKTSTTPTKDDAKDPVIVRNCIEGPWGEWSECSHRCQSDKVRPIQIIKRNIYAKNAGAGSKSCSLIDSRECKNLPPCSTFCFSREGSGRKEDLQQQYFFLWSENCVTHVNDKMGFSYSLWNPNNPGASSAATVIGKGDVTHLSPLRARDSTLPPLDVSDECKDPNNWTSCNAPCTPTTGEEPVEYLRSPILCHDTRRPCSGPLQPCLVNTNDNSTTSYGACILRHARYDIVNMTWSQDGSCICEAGVPCTADELYVGLDYSDMLVADGSSTLESRVRGTPYQSFISLANFRRLEIPLPPLKDVTYGTFKQDDVGRYCASGNLHLELFAEEILWVNCDLAVPRVPSHDSKDCQTRCRVLRDRCEKDIPQQTFEEMAKCLEERILEVTDNLYVIRFTQYLCHLPNLGKVVHEERQICESTSPVKGNGTKCTESCHRILNMCKMTFNHKREERIRRCMLNHVSSNDVTGEDGNPLGFNDDCRFKRAKLYGSGLVYCKSKQVLCDTENWSDWSDCSGPCINLDPQNRILPTRSRTRMLKNHDPVTHANCLTQGVQFVETADCLWLPQCPDDRIITNEIAKTRRQVAWASAIETKWDLQSWVLQQSYEEDIDEPKDCNIYSGQRDVSNNKIIYQKSRCSCPPMMTPCSVSESIKSYGWFDMVQLLCQENEMRSVLFNQTSGFYRFSCFTKTFIREDFDAHKELCNEVDGTSFVSCSGTSIYTTLYIFAALAATIGCLLGILIFVYTYNRSSFV